MNFTFSKTLPIKPKPVTASQSSLQQKLSQLSNAHSKIQFGSMFQNLKNAKSCSSCGK